MSKAETIEAALEAKLAPEFLEVVDESHMHNVPPGAESHFKVVVVAKQFEGKPLVARHRIVNAVVSMSELQIHALALHTYAPTEDSPQRDTQSPDCLGGTGK